MVTAAGFEPAILLIKSQLLYRPLSYTVSISPSGDYHLHDSFKLGGLKVGVK